MLIAGLWKLGDDRELRPVIQAEVSREDGSWVEDVFLVDSGADRTVLSADALAKTGLPPVSSPEHLLGVGGKPDSIVVETSIRMKREDGSFARIRGRFFAFTRPESLDQCILGRDILNLFAVILDRPQDVVCLLGQNHRYQIITA
jgi:hypothetical protein